MLNLATSNDSGRQWRAGKRLGVIGIVAGVLLFLIPAPFGAVAVGTVWVPEEANARSRAAGEVAAIFVKPGQQVVAGDQIASLRNSEVERRVAVAQAKVHEMEASYTQAFSVNRVEAAISADWTRLTLNAWM